MKKDFVSLAEARPDLAKEWNYEKNGDLKPKDVSYVAYISYSKGSAVVLNCFRRASTSEA